MITKTVTSIKTAQCNYEMVNVTNKKPDIHTKRAATFPFKIISHNRNS